MKLEHVLAVLTGLLVPLNAGTFSYVVSIEHRLTRLETKDELARSRGTQLPPARKQQQI